MVPALFFAPLGIIHARWRIGFASAQFAQPRTPSRSRPDNLSPMTFPPSGRGLDLQVAARFRRRRAEMRSATRSK
jgi:hypothetical protein